MLFFGGAEIFLIAIIVKNGGFIFLKQSLSGPYWSLFGPFLVPFWNVKSP